MKIACVLFVIYLNGVPIVKDARRREKVKHDLFNVKMLICLGYAMVWSVSASVSV